MALVKSADVPAGIDADELPEECPECGGDVVLDQDYLHCETWDWEQEAPMSCPECGEDEVFGDGCAFECEWCGFTWGHESRRPAPDDPAALQEQQSVEPEINKPGGDA